MSHPRKRPGATCGSKWSGCRLLANRQLSMEAADEGIPLHACSEEALRGSWTHDEKPKQQLRFATKIAAAMDADGFVGVKASVCGDDMQTPAGVMNLEKHYCGGPSSHRTPQRVPVKQAHRPPQRRRRWRLLRRKLCKTRVLFACIVHKVKKAFGPSSRRSLQVCDELNK